MMSKRRELELYLHIPFCVRKCNYCDFLSEPGSREQIHGYIRSLAQEIAGWGRQLEQERYQIYTIFLGGGTPSCLQVEDIDCLAAAWTECFDVGSVREVTIEANPGTVTGELAAAWKRAGINRVSVGLQSAQNQELKYLGRIHTWQQFLESYEILREEGFDSINIDLMSGIPIQTVASYQDTLEKVVALGPEHISAYSLIVEAGTKFAQMQQKGQLDLVSEETDRQMYQLTKTFLHNRGYDRYEISNYAKPGMECIHNCGYWQGREYLGLGLGASSMLQNHRFANPTVMQEYEKYVRRLPFCDWKMSDILKAEYQTISRRMEEFMFLGLRMQRGISPAEFECLFSASFTDIYGKVVREMKEKKLLAEDCSCGRIYLTDLGIDLSNYVLSEFLLDNE